MLTYAEETKALANKTGDRSVHQEVLEPSSGLDLVSLSNCVWLAAVSGYFCTLDVEMKQINGLEMLDVYY